MNPQPSRYEAPPAHNLKYAITVQLITKSYEENYFYSVDFNKVPPCFAFLQFLITQRRANLLPPYPLIYHNPRIATEDRETANPSRWDSAQRSVVTTPPPHPLEEERIGCVIPDWRLEVAWHLRE